MKIKLDRARHEMVRHGISYRVGKSYALHTTDDAGQVSKLQNIGYHGKTNTYFLNFENGSSINADFAHLYLEEV